MHICMKLQNFSAKPPLPATVVIIKFYDGQMKSVFTRAETNTIHLLKVAAGADPGFSEGGVRIRSGYRGWC